MTTNVNRVPRGPKPNTIKASRIILYSVLVVAAFYYLLPLYVMVMTSLKDLDDVRQGNIFALPLRPEPRCLVQGVGQRLYRPLL